jgi:hypothetical protein
MEKKLTYKEEGLRRMKIRKEKRVQNYTEKCYEKRNRVGCQVCGEHPYCYCGDGTPYSY